MRSKDICRITYSIAGMVPTVGSNEVFSDVMQRGTSLSGRDHMQCEKIFMNICGTLFGTCGKLEWGGWELYRETKKSKLASR